MGYGIKKKGTGFSANAAGKNRQKDTETEIYPINLVSVIDFYKVCLP